MGKSKVDRQRVDSVTATLLARIDGDREYVALSGAEKAAVDADLARTLGGR